MNQISKKTSIKKQVRPGFHFYFAGVIVIDGGVFWYFTKRLAVNNVALVQPKPPVSNPPVVIRRYQSL